MEPNSEYPQIREINLSGRAFRVVATSDSVGFWDTLQVGTWEPETFELLCTVTDQHVYIDIGCWIGPTLLFAAQKSKSAFGFEPDPVAFEELKTNLRVNETRSWCKKITLLPKAVSPKSGTLQIGNRQRSGDSTTSELFATHAISWTVPAIDLNEFIQEEGIKNSPLWIKIDIEGGEFALCPSLKSLWRAPTTTLYLSLHTAFLIQSKRRSNSYLSKVLTRLSVLYDHARLFSALSFPYLYHSNGDRLLLPVCYLRLLFTGTFPTEVFATHQPLTRIMNRDAD
jgi:FkbM family methyltransferase